MKRIVLKFGMVANEKNIIEVWRDILSQKMPRHHQVCQLKAFSEYDCRKLQRLWHDQPMVLRTNVLVQELVVIQQLMHEVLPSIDNQHSNLIPSQNVLNFAQHSKSSLLEKNRIIG